MRRSSVRVIGLLEYKETSKRYLGRY